MLEQAVQPLTDAVQPQGAEARRVDRFERRERVPDGVALGARGGRQTLADAAFEGLGDRPARGRAG